MRFFDSVRALYLAVAILFVTWVIGLYGDIRSGAMERQRLELATGMERVMRLSGELNTMLLVAVLDQNLLRAASYDTVDADLRDSMKRIGAGAAGLKSMAEIAALEASASGRRSLEEDILAMIREEKWEMARSVMFGDAYVFARKTNEIDIETAVSAVGGELSASAAHFHGVTTLTLALRSLALVFLVYIGVSFSRRSRLDLEEQIRLRTQVSSAKDELEQRVKDRTADLEEKTRLLAVENEERLKSEARTRLILKSAGEGILGVDTEGRLTFSNDAAAALLGRAPEELVGLDAHDTMRHADPGGRVYERESCPVCRACGLGEERHGGDERFHDGNGLAFPAEYSVMPIHDGSSGLEGAVIVFRDVTAQKKARDALRDSQEFLQAVIDNCSSQIYAKDLEGRYILGNKAWLEMVRWNHKDVIGRTDAELFPREDAELFRANDLKVLALGKFVQGEESALVNGERRVFLSSKFPIREPGGEAKAICGISTDITEFKDAERIIKESEKQLRTIFENSPLGIIHMSADGTIMDCNERFVELMGSSRGRLIGFNSVRQGKDPAMVAALRKALAGYKAEYENWYTSTTGGKTVPLHMNFNPVNAGENPTEVIVTLEDITERKKADKELEERLEELERFNRLTVSREERMIELKKEINEALEAQGLPGKFKIVE